MIENVLLEESQVSFFFFRLDFDKLIVSLKHLFHFTPNSIHHDCHIIKLFRDE